jgi:uncharacterized protein YkwD
LKVSHTLLFFSLFTVGCGTTTHYVYKQSTVVSNPYPAPSLSGAVKESYIKAVNTMRSKGRTCGKAGYFPPAPSLRWSEALYRAAYEHSADMLANNMFTHEGSGKASDWTAKVQHLGRISNFTDRIENNGYKQWKRLAQNIAGGMPTVAQTMQQWETSEYHCVNIMNPVFTDFGMAHTYKAGTKFSHYWTQNFATHQ